MKKTAFFLIVCFLVFPVFAEDFEDEQRGKRLADRKFEIGFKAGFSFSNDLLTLGDIFSDRMVINLDNMSSGFNMGLYAGITPLFFNYVNDNGWGFGLSLFNIEASGNISLAGEMLSLTQAANEKSDVNAAIFVEIAAPVFFKFKDFKFKIKPSFYYPVLYAEPEISYTYSSGAGGNTLEILYGICAYTGFSNVISNEGNLTASMGISLSIGVEYPLSTVLGLTEKSRFLDFDVALDIVNIPLLPAVMKSYTEMSGRIYSYGDTFEDFLNDIEMDDEMEEYSSDEGDKKAYRAFKMAASANWRPFMGDGMFTVIPSLGFCINPLYVSPLSLEIGIKARLDLANRFIATVGINYTDRTFINSLDLALNMRSFELNLGVSLQSQRFLKSWLGSGFGVDFGLKLGW